MNTDVLVLLSGGIDSTACAYLYKSQGFSVEALFIDYGQPSASKEAEASRSLAEYLSIPIRDLCLMGQCDKEGGEIKGRNAFLLLAALMEFPSRSGIVGIGLNTGTQYYDCSEEFVKKLQEIFDGYTDGCIQLGVPFLKWHKAELWEYFCQARLPTHMTYSCELGLQQPCGKCLSCRDLEALDAC